MTEQTKVVFRKYKDGSILALFPSTGYGLCLIESYMHIGQHGGADYNGCILDTKPATPAEYQELKTELESLGYNLKVIKRRSNR